MADLNAYMNGYKVGIFSRECTGAHMFQYVDTCCQQAFLPPSVTLF
jgi:serine/threonine-protein kinase HipA